MIDIVHRHTKVILYHSETAQTIAEAVAEALKNSASLQHANLQYANLQYANLQYANLQGASLQYASLQYASLQGANLQYASLQGASLQGANLQGASLQGVKKYANSHAMFAEATRRLPIDTFSTAEWAAIGQIIVHRPCWETIYKRYADIAPHVLDVLAEAGFTEWRDYWAALAEEEQS